MLCSSHTNLWKELQYLLNRRLGGPLTRCGHFGKEENLLPLPGVEPWGQLTCSVVMILTALLWLVC
jgi:hypothetical protein